MINVTIIIIITLNLNMLFVDAKIQIEESALDFHVTTMVNLKSKEECKAQDGKIYMPV